MGNFFDKTSDNNFIKKNFYEGTVINNDDINLDGVLIVRVDEIDVNTDASSLPKCFPVFSIANSYLIPQIGDKVLVAFDRDYQTDEKLNKERRYWFGILNQSLANNFNNKKVQTKSPKFNKKVKGLYPNLNDVAFLGKNDNDILLREDGAIFVRINTRNELNENNTTNPSYIQLNTFNKKKVNNTKQKDSNVKVTSFIKIEQIDGAYILKLEDIKGSLIFQKTIFGDNVLKDEVKNIQSKYPAWQIITDLSLFRDWKKIHTDSIEQTDNNVSGNENTPLNVISYVADKLNLITHKGNKFDTKSNLELTEEVLENIMNNGESMVRGNILKYFLSLMRTALIQHIHPFSGLPTTQDNLIKQILSFDLNTLVNEDIKVS